MADPRIRQLVIKSGVAKRLAKEKVSYEQEAEQIQDKIKKMQREGQEIYYIKKQEGLLQETLIVIVDVQKRLNVGYQELQTFVENEKELAKTEEYKAAKLILADVKSAVDI